MTRPAPSFPVLLYRGVSDAPDAHRKRLNVPPMQLEEHIAAILDSGRVPLTISELTATMRARALPENVLAVTFDDGYEDTLGAAAQLAAQVSSRPSTLRRVI